MGRSVVRPRSRRFLIQYLPVSLLLLGISIHGVRIIENDEDPQRGSAFAMFATVDIGGLRAAWSLRCQAPPPISLVIPDALDEERVRLTDAPSGNSARDFAEGLLDLTWEVQGHRATVGEGVTFRHVRVQVVGLEVDGRSVSKRILTDVVVEGLGS